MSDHYGFLRQAAEAGMHRCYATDRDTDEYGWRPCPASLCEADILVDRLAAAEALIRELDAALARERGGGTPLGRDSYIDLHQRARAALRCRTERGDDVTEAEAAVATIRRTLREADRLDGGNDPSLWQNADDAALFLLGEIALMKQQMRAYQLRLDDVLETQP